MMQLYYLLHLICIPYPIEFTIPSKDWSPSIVTIEGAAIRKH